jgi:peptide/nickel transport system ATP-binding protein
MTGQAPPLTGTDASAHGGAAPLLSVRHLHITLGEGAQARPVLHGIDIALAQGQAFGLVGESGSGKTTVLRCLAGQYRHWQGEVRIAGEQVPCRGRDAGRTAARLAHARRVQMVFQDPYAALHPRHTVRTALAEPLRVHRADRIDERIDEALSQVGLPMHFRHRYPHQLSGGQRQRVAIARALVLQPPLILLDEPTSALDVSVQAEVLNLLDELRRSRGLTYLLVSHDLGVVAHLCSRLAVMQHGRIVETLSTDALCAGQAVHPYTRALLADSEGPQERPAPFDDPAPLGAPTP